MYTFTMKKLLLLIPVAFMLNSCSQVDGANPSQNKALNAVAGKLEKEPALMQNLLDEWLKNEWTPIVSGATAPTGQTEVKIVPNKDGSAKLVEVQTGVVLKELTKEQTLQQEDVQSKYKEEDRNFTLQEYIDKMAVYNNTHPSDEKNSHVTKINSMPVIGKN